MRSIVGRSIGRNRFSVPWIFVSPYTLSPSHANACGPYAAISGHSGCGFSTLLHDPNASRASGSGRWNTGPSHRAHRARPPAACRPAAPAARSRAPSGPASSPPSARAALARAASPARHPPAAPAPAPASAAAALAGTGAPARAPARASSRAGSSRARSRARAAPPGRDASAPALRNAIPIFCADRPVKGTL